MRVTVVNLCALCGHRWVRAWGKLWRCVRKDCKAVVESESCPEAKP